MISGKVVCLAVWIATLGLSKSYYYGVRQLFLQGCKRIVSHIHRNPTQKTNEAVAWLDNFLSLMGDKMPNRGTIHLPSCFSKLSIYQRLVQEFKDRRKDQIISQSQFFEIWKTHFHHVSIPKVQVKLLLSKACFIIILITQENRFTKCDVCSLIHRELEKTTEPMRRQELT